MNKVIFIEWMDSHSADGVWSTLEELRGLNKTLKCESIGFVIDENDTAITIVGSISYGGLKGTVNQGGGSICIPKVAIIKSHVLSEGDLKV